MNTKIFSKSILGGIAIAIASYIYINTGGICGAALFSVGLLIILNMKLKLFTGTIGYIESQNYLKENLLVLLGNIVGCIYVLPFQNIIAQGMIESKLSLPFGIVLAKSIVCGILIYAAVECFMYGKDYMVPLCVVAFIMFGAEHCIADLCYALMSQNFSTEVISFLFTVTIGNAIGAIMMHIGTKEV